MREAGNHEGVEKEQRKTSKHPFSEERQKDFYPLILSHQPFFWNKRSPPNRSENQFMCQNLSIFMVYVLAFLAYSHESDEPI